MQILGCIEWGVLFRQTDNETLTIADQSESASQTFAKGASKRRRGTALAGKKQSEASNRMRRTAGPAPVVRGLASLCCCLFLAVILVQFYHRSVCAARVASSHYAHLSLQCQLHVGDLCVVLIGASLLSVCVRLGEHESPHSCKVPTRRRCGGDCSETRSHLFRS